MPRDDLARLHADKKRRLPLREAEFLAVCSQINGKWCSHRVSRTEHRCPAPVHYQAYRSARRSRRCESVPRGLIVHDGRTRSVFLGAGTWGCCGVVGDEFVSASIAAAFTLRSPLTATSPKSPCPRHRLAPTRGRPATLSSSAATSSSLTPYLLIQPHEFCPARTSARRTGRCSSVSTRPSFVRMIAPIQRGVIGREVSAP